MIGNIQRLKIKFIARVGLMGKYGDGEEKYHLIIPRKYVNEIRKYKGEDVRVVVDDEF